MTFEYEDGPSYLRPPPSKPRMYLVIACTHCNHPIIIRQGRRSRRCSFCEKTVHMSSAKLLGQATTLDGAREILNQKSQTMITRKRGGGTIHE